MATARKSSSSSASSNEGSFGQNSSRRSRRSASSFVVGESSDLAEYELLSYETISSTQSYKLNAQHKERLHEWLSAEQIEMIYEKFMATPDKSLNHTVLRTVLEDFDIQFDDFGYKRLFLKINQNPDVSCDWNEFISYLIFGFQEDDPATQNVSLILPISVPPLVKKSEHRSPICCLTLVKPTPDDVTYEDLLGEGATTGTLDDSSDANGMWVSASREGQIRFWTTALTPIRTVKSESFHLPMQTYILDMQAMADVNILCVTSTERELRFHETVGSFTLRMVIRSLPGAVNALSYNFHPNGGAFSRLLLGDHIGNVRVLEFSPYLRGPFQSKPGAAMIDVCWVDVVKGILPLIFVRSYEQIHTEWISKMFFSIRLGMLITAAEYRNIKKYRGRCPGLVTAVGNDLNTFGIPHGVRTFFVDEKSHILVTGGSDSNLRVWDVFMSNKPTAILTGHNSGIVMVFIQPEENKLYSVDYRKVLKVWDMREYTCLQTFGGLVDIFAGETELFYYYHNLTRDLLIGGRRIATVKCSPRLRVDLTDGNTHAAPVTVVLYNRLFRNVVTCGLDSNIVVWDPWLGCRQTIMKNCHTKVVYGEILNIEITCACFDPLDQFLVTGARDGSLKVWSYNNAVCIRNMSIKKDHEVTAVMWVLERILAVGWDQQVTEFNDVEGCQYMDPKKWPIYHAEDITCADVKAGEGVITATYSGELVFWKLETGQPYRRYNVSHPQKFVEISFNRNMDKSKKTTPEPELNISKFVRQSISRKVMLQKVRESDTKGSKKASSSVPTSVQAVLFLQSRPISKHHGTVCVALDSGIIQIYSHHQRGGYLGEFNAAHKTSDCVLAMCSDRKNKYLFTGTAFGYIKIWHIQNYCVPEKEKVHICMPLLRLQFIFLRKERFMTRAKRVVRNQLEPILLSSFLGHLKAINSISFINYSKIMLSGSHDCSVRMWSLGGRYLGTLGSPLPWKEISMHRPHVDEPEKLQRLPPDIKKVASFTTMKVISGVQVDYAKAKYQKEKEERIEEEEVDDDEANLFGEPLDEPVLGAHFSLPGRSAGEQNIVLDTTVSYMPVFNHLRIHEVQPIPDVVTPRELKALRRERKNLDSHELSSVSIGSAESGNRSSGSQKSDRSSL